MPSALIYKGATKANYLVTNLWEVLHLKRLIQTLQSAASLDVLALAPRILGVLKLKRKIYEQERAKGGSQYSLGEELATN